MSRNYILGINVILYFFQFVIHNGVYFFIGLVFLNLVASGVCFLTERAEAGKSFLLSVLVLLLIGPVVVMGGVALLGAYCFLSAGHNHI